LGASAASSGATKGPCAPPAVAIGTASKLSLSINPTTKMIDLIPDDGLAKTAIIIALSAGSMWAAHEYAHQIYGANAEAIGDVGIVVFLFAGIGTYLALATAGMFFGGDDDGM
jgi:hypothetical protein